MIRCVTQEVFLTRGVSMGWRDVEWLDRKITEKVTSLASRRDIPHLIKVLGYREETAAQAAAAALANIGEDAVEPLMRSLRRTGQPTEVALAMIGEPAVAPVAKALWRGDTRLAHTLGLLAGRGAEGASQALCEMSLLHADEAVRTALRVAHQAILGETVFGLHDEYWGPTLEAPAAPEKYSGTGDCDEFSDGISAPARRLLEKMDRARHVAEVAEPLLEGALQQQICLRLSMGLDEHCESAPPGLQDDWQFQQWVSSVAVVSGLYEGLDGFCVEQGIRAPDAIALTPIRNLFGTMWTAWSLCAREGWFRDSIGWPADSDTNPIPAPSQHAQCLMQTLLSVKAGFLHAPGFLAE